MIVKLTKAQRRVLTEAARRARVTEGVEVTQDVRIGRALIRLGLARQCGAWVQQRRAIGYFGRGAYYQRTYAPAYCLTPEGVAIVQQLAQETST